MPIRMLTFSTDSAQPWRQGRAVTLLITLLVGLACGPNLWAVDFKRDVAPILARRCLTCHDAETHKGDFRIDSREAVLESGYVEPGDPDASELLNLVNGVDGKAPRMPKDSDPLRASDIESIRRWIEEGADWPEAFRLEPPRVTDFGWWSLQPLPEAPKAPALSVEAKRWVRTPIDAFILAKLSERGLTPSPEADRRTLIRRLYFDLIGLPPSPEQVRGFLADDRPDAYARLVDHLLESRHYGERWARHWLDVVHYADTHGYDKDKLRPNAWPYRDYVIRAFNEDKPYSRFVKEQLVGDALWPHTVDGPVATGFISAGPWDFIGHAEVPETKLDGKVARNLDRDNMVTSTMNTFCSLTIQCARCHHHKLDPVTMEDYYSLQAVFAALDRADRTYDSDPQVARRRGELARQRDEARSRLAAIVSQINKKKTPQITQLEERISQLAESTKGDAPKTPRSNAYGYHSQVAARQDAAKWVQFDLGREVAIDDVFLAGADEYGWADFGFPQQFHVSVSNSPTFDSETVVARFDQDTDRPGAYLIRISAGGAKGRFVRVTATKLWSRRRRGEEPTKDWIFALGEMAVYGDGQLVQPAAVQAKDSIEALPRWGRQNLTDGVFGSHNLDTRIGGPKTSPTNGFHSQFADTANKTKWVQLELAKPTKVSRIEIVPAFPTDWDDTPGFGFPIRFRIESSAHEDFREAETLVRHEDADFANPGQHRFSVVVDPAQAKYFRITATKLWERGEGKHAFALAEVQLWSNGENAARTAKLSASDSIEAGRWSIQYLADGYSSRLKASPDAAALATLASPSLGKGERSRLQGERDRLIREVVGEVLLEQRDQAAAELTKFDAALGSLPKPQKVYAGMVHQGSGAFRGRAGLGPRKIFVLHRGDIKRPGEKATPGVTPLIPDTPARFEIPEDAPEWKRRQALAEWIVRRDNPLTWRSIVNRVWLYHFGAGIVDTPNDFGRGGARPTHPELLDWLAVHFRDSGQSMKALHRLIVNSATYRQAVAVDAEKAKSDVGNQYYWRMNRRRLTAEEIRDTVLAVSGKLDQKMGGPGFQDFAIEFPQHSPHYEYEKYDSNDKATHRRAVYRFIVRSQPQPFMDTLDCADPSMSVPKRSETLTSLQALALMNNRFMLAMAEGFAERLQQERNDEGGRVRLAIELCLGRPATDAESETLTEYAREHGMANMCRLLFNVNEFVFVD